MTWLHRTAQEILARERTMILPTHIYGSIGGKVNFTEIHNEAQVGSRRVDCLGVAESGERIAIEIRVTHEVDEEKLRDFQEQDMSAVEVDLRELADALPDWDMLREAVCESVQYIEWLHDPIAYAKELAATSAFEEHLRNLVRQHDVGPYSDQYRVSAVFCWECDEATPIFQWDKIDSVPAMPAAENTPPPEPRPRTLVLGYSNMAGTTYWGNRCAECNALQGDFFLFTNKLDYAEDWFEQNGNGVGYWDAFGHH